ncbi:armadillo-type protein, partial [Syncephalis pseudoplumigaleata]
ERQTPTRSLWIGNLPAHVTSTDLMQIFSAYGIVESLRVLPDRDCAFINYQQVEDAARAHDDMRGARLGGSLIRVGFGKADVYGTDMQGMQPTRALWIGNISPHTTTQILQQIFTPFGVIESVRVLTHKNCGFVNFERTEDAMRAKSVMNGQEIAGAIVRIGFAKVPALELSAAGATTAAAGGVPSRGKEGGQMHIVNTNFSFPPTKNNAANAATSKHALNDGAAGLDVPSEGFDGKPLALQAELMAFNYASALPALPPVNPHRRIDASRLRDIRKRLDTHPTAKDVDAAFNDLYPELVELSFDYIGNTVIQKLAEHGTPAQKLQLLEKVAPHFASIGVHKNGTWAVQKMIDTADTPEQMDAICRNIKAYAPPLLLDQFGNYVVQCCLRFGDRWNQFIFDAMHARCCEIAQGRFGARSMRTCLENEHTTKEQKKHVSTAIAFHALQLTMSANGALLVNWLLDSSELAGRFRVLASRYAPHLAQLAVHKLANATLLKIINQQTEPEARALLLKALFGEAGDDVHAPETSRVLEAILEDQTHGVQLVHKIFTSTFVEDSAKRHIGTRIRAALGRLTVHVSAAHRRLADDITALIGQPTTDTIEEEREGEENAAATSALGMAQQ